MTTERIEFTYRAYVEQLKQVGNNKPSWVANHLRNDCMYQSESAFKTMEELGFKTFTEDCWLQAAEMILNNDKIEI